MRYCGYFLIKAEGGAKNYERDHPLPLAWRPFTIVFLQRKGYLLLTVGVDSPFCYPGIMSSLPSPRTIHFAAGRNTSAFYWGGATFNEAPMRLEPVTDLEYLYELDVVADKWKKHLLKGQHPPGVYSGACAVIADCLYLYGGKNEEGELTGSLFELNLSTKSWRELFHPGAGGQKIHSCKMVACNSTLIIYGGISYDCPTNELHLFDLNDETWWTPRVTGNVPPPLFEFTFTKVSNHQVVLHTKKDAYVLDLSRMYWEKHHYSGFEVMTDDFVAACLGLGSDHAQCLLLHFNSATLSQWMFDVATWKGLEIKLPGDNIIPYGSSATVIQTSPTSVEVIVYGEELVRLKYILGKRAAAPEGVSPVQWWILTDYIWGTKKYKLEVGDMRATELLKTTDPQTFSNTPENTTDNIGEGQVFSAKLSAEELADWLHSHHDLPEGACKILKDQSINGSVFQGMKKEDIDFLGFNFGAGTILLKVLNQIKEHQSEVTSRTELDSNHYSEICRQLVSVKHQWEDMALALGFKDYEIEDIKRDVTLQISGNQLYKVISFWLCWGPKDKRGSKDTATLEALQEALNRTNNSRIQLKI